MCTFNNKLEETYKNIINNVLEDINTKELNKYYFLIKQNELDSKLFSLSKINFRDEILIDLNNDIKEDQSFGILFNNSKIVNKKIIKEKKENYLIEKLISSDNKISNEKIIEKLSTLIKWNNAKTTLKDNKLHLFHNYYSFYDDIFSKNMYIADVTYDFHISNQLNDLVILSLSKYSKILFDILNDLKKYNCKNLKKLIKENVKIDYDQRLMNADTSGKRKRKTIFISEQMTILQISYNNNIYKIKSKIKGFQFDINENIVSNPHNLFMNTQEGWIIILKNKNNKMENFLTPSEYEEKRKNFIQEYNNLLNYFELN
ncbi:conserved Plasmodium protein, unknown function [Plasmodium gallinaceum]|uniref:Uncharacterized protein n=1 Tax=Plasmodium gallinaceum TaxID=5849 RepID=A0A1J1GY83_PLAGA|nr:conserved Plasmodium protein, unknown function [Plasmodium gallinaceum]CRG97421.1 conserved Plasmodium protein, unknown function [Plasmodium gallinaceum]